MEHQKTRAASILEAPVGVGSAPVAIAASVYLYLTHQRPVLADGKRSRSSAAHDNGCASVLLGWRKMATEPPPFTGAA